MALGEALLVLALLGIIQISNAGFCTLLETVQQQYNASCGEFVPKSAEGYVLDRIASGFGNLNQDQIQTQINKNKNQRCVFVRDVQQRVQKCCPNYGGKNCDQVVCDPPCSNGGTCEAGNKCKCPDGYRRAHCDESTKVGGKTTEVKTVVETYESLPVAKCGLSMLEEDRTILPSEAGQPDEDDYATVPLENKVAKIKFPKPSEVTAFKVRATGGLSAEDTAAVTATFVKLNGETETTTFKGSPEEGNPLIIPVNPKIVPLKEMNIKMTITNEDGEDKEIKSVDVLLQGCQLEKKTVEKSTTQSTGDNLGYCYKDTGCLGDHVKAGKPMKKSECCALKGARGWGKLGSCSLCPNDIAGTTYVTDSKTRICASFGQNVYRTFDGLQYVFDGHCSYNAFSVGDFSITVTMKNCNKATTCKKEFELTLRKDIHIMAMDTNNILFNGHKLEVSQGKGYTSVYPGVVFKIHGSFLKITYRSLAFEFNGKNQWTMSVGSGDLPQDKSTIKGLCGNNNGNPTDDLLTASKTKASSVAEFGNSWAVEIAGTECEKAPEFKQNCDTPELVAKAYSYCAYITTKVFSSCAQKVPSAYPNCLHAVCGVLKAKGTDMDNEIESSRCSIMESYTTECFWAIGKRVEWRTDKICAPAKCEPGLVYSERSPACPHTCQNIGHVRQDDCVKETHPGCTCPVGKFIQNGKCIEASLCSCEYQKQSYGPGKKVRMGCNECKCQYGSWLCASNPCPKTCSVIGTQHRLTFDGYSYDFQGTPGQSYVLVKSKASANGSLVITQKIEKCPETNLVKCTQSVKVVYTREKEKVVVEFSKGKIIVNGKDNEALPFRSTYVTVLRSSTVFSVMKGEGFSILYDLIGRIYIRLFPQYANKVVGLCGNNDGSTQSELVMENNAVAGNVLEFGASWLVKSGSTTQIKETEHPKDTCNIRSQVATAVKGKCSKLVSKEVLGDCKKAIDVAKYQQVCEYDYCARYQSDKSSSAAFCAIASALAKTCNELDKKMNWLDSFPECKSKCSLVIGSKYVNMLMLLMIVFTLYL